MKAFTYMTILLATIATSRADSIVAYTTGGRPDWVPPQIEAFSYSDWHSLTEEVKGYNPPD